MLTMFVLSLALQAQSRWNGALMEKSWQLLAAARYGTTDYERAAFATTTADGQIVFIAWPHTSRELRADFQGVIPPHTIAIVHTHPNWSPLPSDQDAALAARLGIRVYTLTRSTVTLTDGRTTRVIATGDWNPARHR